MKNIFKNDFIAFKILVLFVGFSSNSILASAQQKINKCQEESCYEWHFSGHVGQKIDKISEERIIKQENWTIIYPETEEAFRLREDDKNYPQRGQWRGEFWGKYILSVIAASRYYQSDELKIRVKNAVEGLLSTQDENGYIGTYEHSDFVIGNNWNVWSRKYTLWGLVEAWELLQEKSILDAAKHFTDHLISEVGPDGIDIVRTGNFYGLPSSSILQPVVKLYNATNDKKYLEYAEYIVEQWSKHPEGLPDILNKGLSGKPIHDWFPDNDPYRWAKAYEFISCVEGLIELYEVTGKQEYFEAGRNIHSLMVNWERTPIGSVGFQDKYVGAKGLINTLSEICDAVYWSRLSYKLFTLTGEEKYIDEIERTLYNSLLSSFNKEGTWSLRRYRMSHIHIPAQNHFLQHHQCCTDNLPRGLFQAAEVVLTRRDKNIYLSLFSEGEGQFISPKGQTGKIEIIGDFLEKGKTNITLNIDKPEKFSFMIRAPRWSKQTSIKINGQKQKTEILNNWMSIDRDWKTGDKIELSFDLYVYWELFDEKLFPENFHDISFYKNEWAKLKFTQMPVGNNEEISKKYEHVQSLEKTDALPHKPSVTFFYGPLALARDVRITEGDIFTPVQLTDKLKQIKIKPISTPAGIWKAFELNLGKGQKINFCDFSSAGNTWDDNSKFNTWCIIKD